MSPIGAYDHTIVHVVENMARENLWQYEDEKLERWRGNSRRLHYRGPADFLYQHGRVYRPRITPRRYNSGAAKACFANSMMAALRWPELSYVEGIIFAPPGFNAVTGEPVGAMRPIHHAWNADAQGKVVELTYVTTVVASLQTVAYYGVEFPDSIEVAHHVLTLWHTMLDSPRSSYSLLARPWTPPPRDAHDRERTLEEVTDLLRAQGGLTTAEAVGLVEQPIGARSRLSPGARGRGF